MISLINAVVETDKYYWS